MEIGIVGGGINGLCCAWQLGKQGHRVHVYERDTLMRATSAASSKLLHGGLRYLENREFRLVREALRERDAWIKRAPHLARPLRLVLPIYAHSRRPSWMIAFGLFIYDYLAGESRLPKAKRLSVQDILQRDPSIKLEGLLGGYEFSDGQMDDHALGLWVAEQATQIGVRIYENVEIANVTPEGIISTAKGVTHCHDRVVNAAGPWAQHLLQNSGLVSPYQLDLIRGSHLILNQPCTQAYLLEAPNDRRIFFVLPWQGNTLVGTTEVRQSLEERIECGPEEQDYLLDGIEHYFPSIRPNILGTFAGLRPLLRSATDPSKATREYAIWRTGNLVSVLGGKWTTAIALANKVAHVIH
jgi:glycerol-3-phosphate dehydrogenase